MIQKQLYTDNTSLACEKWGIFDITFSCEVEVPTPFDVRFGAEFTSDAGQTLYIPGFFDGDNTWVLRFSPPEQGIWTYITQATLPTLAGKTGSVNATVPAHDEHGPIQPVPDNPQRLQYADGTPYHLLAFELDWLFALDAENDTGIPKAQALIDEMAKYGFNHVVMNAFAYDVTWEKDGGLLPEHEYGASSAFPFAGNNTNPDFSTLNVTYFQRFDRVMDALREAGIVAHLMIYVWNKLVNWPDMYSRADNTYFDYVVHRYQAFTNLVWDISKEALIHGRCDEAYVMERIRRIRKQDAYARMLTVHDYNYCAAHPETIDLFSIQTWQTSLYDRMRSIGETYPTMPVFNIEHGGYERSPYVVFPGDYDDPEICLARNYECVFAGTYSTYYWQATSWNVVIHNFDSLPEAQRPKFSYYKHLADLMQRYNFGSLKPVNGKSSSGLCLSNGEDTWLYYLPVGTYATHIGLRHYPKDKYKATWFNPMTGEFAVHGTSDSSPWREFLVPDQTQMTVLIIEKLN